MKKVVVLGAGLVGRHIARDLSSHFEVTAADRDEAALARAADGSAVQALAADLSTPDAIRRAVLPFDFVVGALPGRLGRMALEAVIRAGRDTVDIAFFPEDARALDRLAKERGVTAVVDFGVAPGMSHVFLGRHAKALARVERYECLVGGLPAARRWPFQYKAPFSPSDVIEEYVRPARFRVNGGLVVREALSDPERVEVPGVGTLEALNTDGLRTLLDSYPDVPDMKEKTLRYPGHGLLMTALRDAGFFSTEPVTVDGRPVRPLDVTSRILFPHFALEDGEEEFTVMRVTVAGTTPEGVRRTIVYDLFDRGDRERGVSSMARTTGFPAAAAVHLLESGQIPGPGVIPPERIGESDGSFAFLLAYHEARGVRYARTVTEA